MDWTQAIDRHRAALVTIVALIGGRDGGGPVTRALRRAALALLRPAEAAARRLIVIAARGLVVAPGAPFPGAQVFGSHGKGAARDRLPAFPLFDRWKRFGPLLKPAPPAGVPRIRTFWGAPAPAPAAALPTAVRSPDPETPVDALRLRLRLGALEAALADLPRQARRLARWRQRAAAKPDALPRPPLRPGHPPGHRRRPDRDIDDVLRDCHALAREALRSDTS
jgi:hypothetical protein